MQGTAAVPRFHLWLDLHCHLFCSTVLLSRGSTIKLQRAGMGIAVPSTHVSLPETLSSESTTRGWGMHWEGTLGSFRIGPGRALERDWL
jgi:hypothetical protein